MLSLAASKLANILLLGAAFVFVFFLPCSIRWLGAKKLRNIGVKMWKHRAWGAPWERVPYCLSAGPFSSSMEKHCERPGSPSAQEGCFHSLTKTISSGLVRYVHCLAPLSHCSNGSLLVFTQTAPLFCLRRVFFLLFSTLGRFPPLSVFGAPLCRRRLLRCC